jgi:DNA-binding beta-propeller fold protein YncE
MRILTLFLMLPVLDAGVVELLGPSGRTVARTQQTERTDGTGHFLEVAMFPSPGVSGFSRVQLWTSKREAGKYTRVRLQEKELQIPDPQRIAKELFEFPLANYSNPNAAQGENRMAVLCGGTDFTLRFLNLQSLTVGRAIVLPPLARQIVLRPGIGEAWVTHAGTSNQISISDPVTERVIGAIPLRLTPQAAPVALFFSASGKTAYVVVRNPDSTTDRGYVFLIDPATRQIRNQISLGTTSPTSALLSPDGSTIYIAGTSLNDLNTAEPSMTYFDTLTNASSLAAIGLPTAPEQMALHPNGLRIYWTFAFTYGLDEYDVQSRRVIRRTAIPRLIQPQGIEFTPNGDVLIIRDSNGQLATHLDPETGEILDTQAIPAGPSALIFRP